jgi:hypothetical protein
MDSSAEKLFSRSLHRRLYEDIILSIGKHKWTRVKFINDTGIPYSPAVSKVNKVLRRLHVTSFQQLYKIDPASLAAIIGFGEVSMFIVTSILESHGYNVLKWWGYSSGNDVQFASLKHRIVKEASKRHHYV